MPQFEYNFTDTQLDLIGTGEERIYLFPQNQYDFIRISIFDEDNLFIRAFDSNDDDVILQLSNNGHKFIYTHNLNEDGTANSDSKVFIKVNEFLADFGFSSGRYIIKFDFLRNIFDNIDSDTILNQVKNANVHFVVTEISNTRREVRLILRDDLDVNPFNFLPSAENSIRTQFSKSFLSNNNPLNLPTDQDTFDVNFVLGDIATDGLIDINDTVQFAQYFTEGVDNIQFITSMSERITNGEFVEGDELHENFGFDNLSLLKLFYSMDINGDGILSQEDFELLIAFRVGNVPDDYENQNGHTIGEPSTITLDVPSDNAYNYNFVLSKPDLGISVPIINYRYDDISNPGFTSLVLRLSVAIPASLTTFERNDVEINQELIDTQTERLYFYQSTERIFTGNGLNIDDSVSYNTTQDTKLYESYNNLTESISDFGVVNHILSQSETNLKTDFTNFENHIFFGSAKKQLESFKIKVSTIQGHLNEISGTLSGSKGEVAIGGDSSYISSRREELFEKIDKEISNFTPYEHFLYFDGQITTSGSAPGLGQNFVDESYALNNNKISLTELLRKDKFSERLSKKDGFRGVYQLKDIDNSYSGELGDMGNFPLPFGGKYRAEQAPFFNYSSSLYLSFLIKTQNTASGGPDIVYTDPGVLNTYPLNSNKFNPIPLQSSNGEVKITSGYSSNSPSIRNYFQDVFTGSKWCRVTLRASSSYWAPKSPYSTIEDIPNWQNQSMVEVLNGNIKTGSSHFSTDNDYYRNLATVITQSGAPFKGSIMPSGELFPLSFGLKTANTSSFITDIKITKNDPSEVHPFGQVVDTGSLTWQNWYNGMLSSASKYDEDNIHSLQNNLPLQYSGSQNLETFVGMMGQQFDLLRMYITNYSSINNRGYSKTNSVPDNLLPILADNLGWNTISPFTSSLENYFGNALNTQDEYRKNELINSTWRKSLNNLIYIYKTKGTQDSINALLNIYGYPNGVVSVEEGGYVNDEQNPSVITSESVGLPAGLGGVVGNVAFHQSDADLHGFRFKGNNSESYDRRIHTNWFRGGASPINGVEFIYKHVSSSNGVQEILLSSGSGANGGENLWDFRVLQKGTGSKFTLRLNKSNYLTPTGSLGTTFTSMSTDFKHIKNGELRNILLTREFNHISGTGTQNYKIYVGSQKDDKIDNYYTASLSVVAADASDNDFNANRNWVGTGSRAKNAGGNLILGRTLSGSLSEFRTWTQVISESKFKQHILNPFSVVGNTLDSSKNEIVYHYKFNELTNNTASLKGTIKINDSNPNKFGDFSVTINEPKLFHSASSFWTKTEVKRNTLQLRIGGSNTKNSNKITFKSIAATKRNLSSTKRSVTTKFEQKSPAGRNTSTKVSIVRSPQRFLNNFIINHFSDSNLSDKIGKPNFIYSSSYGELDTLRSNLFDTFDISFNINQFIDAQAGLLNSEIVDSVVSQLPARSDTEVGVLFEPSLLERDKIEHKKIELTSGKPGPNNLKDEIFISSSVSVYNPISTYENPHSDTINVKDVVSPSSLYENSKDVELSSISTITSSMFYESEKSDTISISSIVTQSMIYDSSKDSTLSAVSHLNQSMIYDSSKDINFNPISTITQSISYIAEKNVTINPINNIIILSTNELPKTGSITFINTNFTKDFEAGDKNWGRDEANDVHFVQANASGSGNTWHYESRYIFRSVGDMEMIDSSTRSNVVYYSHRRFKADTDFTNPNNFKLREIRDKGKGYSYKSYIKNGSDIEGVQDGRPVGSTSYFVTSSDGDILYPINHWVKLGRSGDSLSKVFYDGTKNTGGKIYQLREQEDYSKDAFYRVKVTGDNVLKVNRGKQKKNNDDTLGY